MESKRDTEKQQAAQEAFDSFDTNDDGETSNAVFILLHRRQGKHCFFPRAVCTPLSAYVTTL